MDKEEIRRLFKLFEEKFDYKKSNSLWENQCQIFKNFWSSQILNENNELLIPTDTDPIIRILDTKAKGHQDSDEAVAHLGLPGAQDRLENLFGTLKKQKTICETLNEIFQTTDDDRLVNLINKLKQENKNIDDLTGESAVILNAFLFINNPEKFTCIVSLKHRSKVMGTFGLGFIEQYKSYGEKIIKSNNDIINGFNEKYGIRTTPRALTEFLYVRTSGYKAYRPEIRKLWDQ